MVECEGGWRYKKKISHKVDEMCLEKDHSGNYHAKPDTAGNVPPHGPSTGNSFASTVGMHRGPGS